MKKPSAWKLAEHFQDLLESLFREVDQVALKKQIDALVARSPGVPREKLTKRLIDRAAMSTAVVGAGAGATGGALGVLAMAPDIANLVRQQSRLVLGIAFLYGNEPNLEERFREVLAILAISTGASAGRQSVRYVVERGFDTDIARTIARRVAGRFIERKLPDLAPLVGSFAGAAINYFTVRATGRVAVEYFSSQEKLAAEQPADPSDAPTPGPLRQRAGETDANERPARKRTTTRKPKATKKAAGSPATEAKPTARKTSAKRPSTKGPATKRKPRTKASKRKAGPERESS